jgi:Fe-S oxidoreductase
VSPTLQPIRSWLLISTLNRPVVVCDSETCRWQITHATSLPAIHPVELLAVAYGYEPEGPLSVF